MGVIRHPRLSGNPSVRRRQDGPSLWCGGTALGNAFPRMPVDTVGVIRCCAMVPRASGNHGEGRRTGLVVVSGDPPEPLLSGTGVRMDSQPPPLPPCPTCAPHGLGALWRRNGCHSPSPPQRESIRPPPSRRPKPLVWWDSIGERLPTDARGHGGGDRRCAMDPRASRNHGEGRRTGLSW